MKWGTPLKYYYGLKKQEFESTWLKKYRVNKYNNLFFVGTRLRGGVTKAFSRDHEVEDVINYLEKKHGKPDLIDKGNNNVYTLTWTGEETSLSYRLAKDGNNVLIVGNVFERDVKSILDGGVPEGYGVEVFRFNTNQGDDVHKSFRKTASGRFYGLEFTKPLNPILAKHDGIAPGDISIRFWQGKAPSLMMDKRALLFRLKGIFETGGVLEVYREGAGPDNPRKISVKP